MGAALFAAPFAFADVPDAAQSADVVVLGEFHDNPEHRAIQTAWITALEPAAVVFEMLTPTEADALNAADRRAGPFAAASVDFHWPGIAAYIPVMLASDAPLVGAAQPREAVRAAFTQGAASVFGGGAERYVLVQDIPPDTLETRKQLQFEAHCEAMPLEMMGGMVEAQRFRDAAFARTVLEALNAYGAPVVLVTGNGHARRDWGVPAFLISAAPATDVFVLGQSEAGAPLAGTYDLTLDAAPPKREDPCAAFQ